MIMSTINLDVSITNAKLMELIRTIIHDESFDYKQWSLWNAETLEDFAQLIKNGYKK